MEEYMVLDPDGPWYQVELVVHCFLPSMYGEAKVYAVEVDHNEVKARVFSAHFSGFIPVILNNPQDSALGDKIKELIRQPQKYNSYLSNL
jgi:hypothetical protein